MPDLHERHAHDAEQVGRIRREQIWLDDPEHLQHQRGRGAADPEVEAAVEEVFLVFEQLETGERRQILPGDFPDFDEAEDIHRDLQRSEQADGEEGGGIHSEGGLRSDFGCRCDRDQHGQV